MNNFETLLKLLKEWVRDCCLMPNEQIFRYIMARTSYIRWEDDAVSLITCLVVSPKQQSVCRHVAPLRHIYIIPSQPIFALTPKCCVLSGAAVNTNFIVFGLTQPGLERMIYQTQNNHTNHYTTDVIYRNKRGHRGRDRMVVGFTTTCAISAYHKFTTKVVS